ncbi:MAG: phosphoribosyltransferase [Candidatus Heimdallarchaeota archaeon]|nr:phosphoribosyltransferase [Candidatus Heimdallarchaeota archaeon]
MVEFKIFSWRDIDELARQLFNLVKNDGYDPEIILGISRGGWIPARLLSDMFEARYLLEGHKTSSILATMQIRFYTGIAETHTKPVIAQDVGVDIFQKKILLIDDLADSGESLRCALDYLKLKDPKEVRIGTLLYKPWSKVKPEYYAEEATEWVVFPHEYYEFMTEQTLSKKLDKTEAWAMFLEQGIPDSAVIFFVETFF